MLVMNNTNVNFDAVSQDEEGATLATMGASYSDGSVYFNLTIERNDEAVDADFDEFKEKVLASVASVKITG